jgi:hypothetical protein
MRRTVLQAAGGRPQQAEKTTDHPEVVKSAAREGCDCHKVALRQSHSMMPPNSEVLIVPPPPLHFAPCCVAGGPCLRLQGAQRRHLPAISNTKDDATLHGAGLRQAALGILDLHMTHDTIELITIELMRRGCIMRVRVTRSLNDSTTHPPTP